MIRRLAMLVWTCAVLAACSGGVNVEPDEDLGAALQEVSAGGEPTSLAALTGDDWDTVHIFVEGASAEEVEQVVGSDVLDEAFFSTNGVLMVFMDDDEPIRASAVLSPLLRVSGTTSWSSEVVLEPLEPGAPIDLVEP